MAFHQSWTSKPVRVLFILISFTMLLFLYSRTIPLGYLPSVQRKSILIRIEHKGAFENQIEKVITNPVEREISRIRGIKEIFSVSEQEKARINISFFAETDLDKAYLRVREAVDRVYAALPDGVQRPIIAKSDINSRPVFIAAFENKGYLAEDYLKRLYENIKGTGEIDIGGGVKMEVQISFYPDKTAQAKISVPQILNSIRGNNIVGGFGRETEIPHIIDARLKNIEEVRALRVTRDITLGEIAQVRLEKAKKESIGRVNGKEKIIVYVHEAGDANTVNLCRKLKCLTLKIPEGMILYNYGEKIEKSLEEILISIISGIVFVTALTFIFLKKIYPALLVSLNIPFSVLFTAACLNSFGYELNIMTLSGIAIGIGLVIDSGIVYVEEFFASKGDLQKTLQGSSHPILFSSCTTIAVFIPLLFAQRELTDQFGGLAIAVSSSIIASAIFVFLFMPAFLSLFFKRDLKSENYLKAKSSPLISGILKRAFFLTSRFRPVFIGLTLILVAASGFILHNLRRQNFNLNTGNTVSFKLEYPSGTTLDQVFNTASELEDYITSLNGIKTSASKYEKERASFDLTLNDNTEQKPIIKKLKSREHYYKNIFFYFPEKSDDEDSFDVILTGKGNTKLRELSKSVSEEIRKDPAVTGIIFHYKDVLPSKQVAINLHDSAGLGVNPKDLYSHLYWSLSGPVASKWNPPGQTESGNAYADIRLFAGKLQTAAFADLMNIKFTGPDGKAVELKDMASFSEKQETGRIYHSGRQRSVSFSVRTRKADKFKILQRANRIISDFPFPGGYRAEAGRTEKEEERLKVSSAVSLSLSILLILIILVFQFEGIRIPLIIMSQIPLSFILPVLLLKILNLSLSMPVMIGLILTAGISVNNCILVFDRLKGRILSGISVYTALEAKFKAMLIASLTTVMSVLPLFFVGRIGAGVLAPLSLTISAGITGSVIFLLISLPVLFK